MQPYIFPYIGYYQLIHSVDLFVIYDNIKYTKKGWINRNRILQNGTDAIFTIPLRNDSDYLDIKDRIIASDFKKSKFINKISSLYREAPFYEQTIELFTKVILNEESNLFEFLNYSLIETCKHIRINTKIIKSSDICIDHSLKSAERIIAICKYFNAKTYVNSIGGQGLYQKEYFKERNIHLDFIKPEMIKYNQFENQFIPWLSIIDVLMFNDIKEVRQMLDNYTFT